MATKSAGMMTDAEIVQYIQDDLSSGIAYVNSALSNERQAALNYYYGEWPKRLHEGSSSYISLDVYDMVETTRSLLAETFVGSRLPFSVSKVWNALQDTFIAEAATKYINAVVFNSNPGEDIFDSLIFDALTARIGVAKVYWKKDEKVIHIRHENVPPGTGDTLDSSTFRSMEITSNPDGSENLEIEQIQDSGHVCIEVVRPEDFLINVGARTLSERTIGERIQKRLSEWVSDGFAEDDLMAAIDQEDPNSDIVTQARVDTDTAILMPSQDEPDPLITLIEAYPPLPIEKGEPAQMYRVLLAGDKLLEKEEVDTHPYLVYAPLRVSHIVHGANFVKSVIPTANAKTVLTRSVIDHAVRTNTPRWEVVKGTIMSPKELLANRLGGIVNVKREGGINPLQQPPMNPYVFSTLQWLDSSLEDTTGISKVTQGTDKEVISKQNSESMVQAMDARSQRRLRMMARRFAFQFLVELARKVYTVAQANDSTGYPLQVRGQVQQVVPSQWPPQLALQVDLNLAPEQRTARAVEIAQTYATVSQDPGLSQAIQWGAKREMMVEFLKLRGFDDAETMVSPQPPQPDPMAKQAQQLDLQGKQLALQLDERKQKVSEQKAQNEHLVAIAQLQGKEREWAFKQMQLQADTAMEGRKQASKEANDAFEKTMLLDQYQHDPESVNGVVSVNR